MYVWVARMYLRSLTVSCYNKELWAASSECHVFPLFRNHLINVNDPISTSQSYTINLSNPMILTTRSNARSNQRQGSLVTTLCIRSLLTYSIHIYRLKTNNSPALCISNPHQQSSKSRRLWSDISWNLSIIRTNHDPQTGIRFMTAISCLRPFVKSFGLFHTP